MKKDIIKIDCFGDICPVPVLKLEKKLRTMKPGEELMLVTDHSCTIESIKELFEERGMIRSVDEVMNGVWEVVIVRL